MWKKIEETELFLGDRQTFVTLNNSYGCTKFTDKRIKNCIIHKIDCNFFIYDSLDYKILLAFKEFQKTGKVTYIAFTIAESKTEDISKALDVIANKTKEYLQSRNKGLLVYWRAQEVEDMNSTIGELGYYSFFNLFKTSCENIGLTMNFDETKLEIDLL